MFKKTLEEIIERTEGSLGALIMGIDGIAVEQVIPRAGQDANLDVAAAEFTSLIRSAQTSGRNTGFGDVKEIVIFARIREHHHEALKQRILSDARLKP
ncbi:MAG: roadblock/LC7 domain-containing protein [Pyrinomonadaceae bacterium]